MIVALAAKNKTYRKTDKLLLPKFCLALSLNKIGEGKMGINFSRRETLAGASALIASINFQNAFADNFDFSAFLEKLTYDRLKNSPEQCTSLNIDPNKVGGPYSSKLTDKSAKAIAHRIKNQERLLGELKKIDASKLSDNDAMTLNILKSSTQYSVDIAKVGIGDSMGQASPYVISQLTGSYQSFPDFMDGQHKVKNKDDADAWLLRLNAFATQMQDDLLRAKSDFQNGIIPPSYILDTTIKQLNVVIDGGAKNSPLVTSLIKKANDAKLDGNAYGQEATKIFEAKILPQYIATRDAIKEIRNSAKPIAGVGQFKNGDKFYEKALARATTTNMTPKEVHELGKKILVQTNSQMDELLKQIGYKDGTLAARMEKLYSDPNYAYPNNDEGKAKVLADINVMVDGMNARLGELFETLPKAKVEVKAVPKYIEAGAPNGYYQRPAIDGSRPGFYFINLRDTKGWPKWSLPTLTYHEASPGHHNQIALAQENKSLPFIRANMMGFTAYSEGWALYAEQIADEIGMYENNPAGRLGYLQSTAFRASRLVVDTGMHAFGWSKQQAIDYMYQTTGKFIPQIESEIERYIVWPGQACSYMIGRQKIVELREYAKAKMGDKFDIRKFHNIVLSQGAVPLDILEKIVKNWANA